MAINPQIQATVDILDERITNLQTIRRMLLSEYGVVENGASPQLSFIETAKPQKTPRKPAGAGSTRKVELIRFLLNEPASRGEIAERTGIPAGTVSYLLHDKNTFERLENGKYQVRSRP
jgi:hypothetical protein